MMRIAKVGPPVKAVGRHRQLSQLRLADRFVHHPFQSFGAVMGMDWHSSGITTSVIGAVPLMVSEFRNAQRHCPIIFSDREKPVPLAVLGVLENRNLLIDDDGHIWCIDNGLAFHAEPKLRTVIWDFAGEEVPADLLEDVGRVVDGPLPDALSELLSPFERDALVTRARALIRFGDFPGDPTGHAYPWPLV